VTGATSTRANDLALAIRHYLAGAEEAGRLRAYEVARDAMSSGAGLLELIADHREALAILLSAVWTLEESAGVVKASAELLEESLGPYEMAYRGFQEANESLTRVNRDLEQQVIERRKAEEGARLAGEEAERANRSKSDFLSRMSHELRTPLNAILGFGQLLEMEQLSDEQREGVEQILKGGRHLLDLINEVLDIARIEIGRIQLSIEPVGVLELIAELLDLVRPLASERQIELRADSTPGPDRFCMADRQRLKQALLNLLSNAVKYNREGGAVYVSCEEVGGERLLVRVTDQGHGIAPDKLQRLFTPFDRLGAEETGVEGTGLGLALSNRLVEAMGGTITVESEVGRGSTFVIELPLAEAEGARDGATAAAEHVASRLPVEPRTLLYIEDNPANLKLVQRLVDRRASWKLLSAMQGSLGLDLARQHHPDLVLLDLHLPDMSGVDVLRALLDDPRTRSIPVVVISADATAGQIPKLLAAGAKAYLTKPLDLRRLLQVIDETIAAERLNDAS
jgi:signal transduction histidine kinase/ActR/RegA family two-component response regulator